MDLVESVSQFLKRHVLFRPGEPLVVGVSGGADSLCLLHVLRELRGRDGLRLIAAHYNHGIRGAEADADEAFVKSLCEAWQVPLLVDRGDVPAVAERYHLSIEDAARRARYTFLAHVARRAEAHYIAVAHNADDQVETVLMHFLRGSGLAGLRGMRPVVPLSEFHLLESHAAALHIVRPLLSVSRAETEACCAENGLAPRRDLSNLDTQYFRNRLRLELLPLLETYNPGVRQVIRRAAEVSAGDYEIIESAADLAWKLVVRQASARGLVFDGRAWRGFPLGLQRMLMRRAISSLRPRLRDIRFDVIALALEVAQYGTAGAKAALPGALLLHVGYDTLTLTSLQDRGPLPDQPLMLSEESLVLEMPGEAMLPELDWALRIAVLGPGEWDAETVRANVDPWSAFVDLACLDQAPRAGGSGDDGDLPALVLRQRRPGDRFQPLGMTEMVRLTEFMINAKVPQVWRDAVPVLAAGPGAEQILWVCGLRLDERVRVTENTKSVLHARFVQRAATTDEPALP